MAEALTLHDQVLINAAAALACRVYVTEADRRWQEDLLRIVRDTLPRASAGHPQLEPVLAELRALLPVEGRWRQGGQAEDLYARARIAGRLGDALAGLFRWRCALALARLDEAGAAKGRAA